MIGLIFIFCISLIVLDTYTVSEIESILNEIAKKNTQDFVDEYAKTIRNQLSNVGMIVGYIHFYMQNLQNLSNTEKPFILPYITPYSSLPSDCIRQLHQYYNEFICLNYSSLYCYSSCEDPKNFTTTLGYVAYVFPDIFNLLGPLLHRILIYIPFEDELIIFPGQKIPEYYDANETI